MVRKKGEVKVTPVSGNVVVVAIAVIVLATLYFIFSGGIPDTGIGGPSGLSAENPIQSQSDVGNAVTDVGMDVQDLTSILKDLDDKIA